MSSIVDVTHQMDVQSEHRNLRESLLPYFLYPLLFVPVIWLIYGSTRDWRTPAVGLVDLATIILVVTFYACMELHERHHGLATAILVAGLTMAEGLVTAALPDTLAPAFGVLAIIVAHSLAGEPWSLAAPSVLWLTQQALFSLSRGETELMPGAWALLCLYALVWLCVWISGRPIVTSVAWSLRGWEQASALVAEARQRAAHLFRTLRALEEATYRIERMNAELREARRRAEEADVQRARFVAMVSHELRGPLNLVLGYSRLMALSPERYGVSLPRECRADVATIYRNSQHLADLVDDILDLSQIEADSLPLVRDRVDLVAEVIAKAVDIVRPLADRKELTVDTREARGVPRLFADAVRLRQVLINILLNAIRFTDTGGITITATVDETAVLVRVRDTGKGIAADKLPELFQEFRQAHRPGAEEPRGSGLGLAISKHLVELHGGKIWAQSEVGVGTTVTFTLPLPGTQRMDATIYVPPRDGVPEGQQHVLVHGDLSLVRVLGRHLQRARLVGVTDAEDIGTVTDEVHPAVILTRAAALPSVRSQLAERAYDVPVIAWESASSDHRDKLEGTIGYLIKPVSPEALMAVMHRVQVDGETTVLLVDDDPDAVRLLEIILTSFPRQYRILRAYGGRQALGIMSTTIPDVVFLDMLMPDVDGREVLQRMRAMPQLTDVPVVVVSARDIEEGLITVSTPLILQQERPVEVSVMAACIQSFLDGSSADYMSETAS